MNLRKRLEEIPLLLQVPRKVCELGNLVFELCNLFALLAFKALHDLVHLRFLRVLDLDRDIEAFRVEIEILVYADRVWDNDGFGVGEETGDNLWQLVKGYRVWSGRDEL